MCKWDTIKGKRLNISKSREPKSLPSYQRHLDLDGLFWRWFLSIQTCLASRHQDLDQQTHLDGPGSKDIIVYLQCTDTIELQMQMTSPSGFTQGERIVAPYRRSNSCLSSYNQHWMKPALEKGREMIPSVNNPHSSPGDALGSSLPSGDQIHLNRLLAQQMK